MNNDANFRSGFVGIVGRPNVGKSTLINKIVGQRIAITSSKPQTTRNRIVGIANGDGWQIAFVDTPGIHEAKGRQINRLMNRNAINSTRNVDVNLIMISADGWRQADRAVLKSVVSANLPSILLINKIDKLNQRELLLPLLRESFELHDFKAMIPIAAKSGDGVPELLDVLLPLLPSAPQMYPPEQITESSDRFLVAEFVREQLFRQLGDELPYAIAVTIDESNEVDGIQHIGATIWVENDGHKPIVIGKGGSRLKKVGTLARRSIENHIGKKCHLTLFVKVKSGWSNDIRRLQELGLSEDT